MPQLRLIADSEYKNRRILFYQDDEPVEYVSEKTAQFIIQLLKEAGYQLEHQGTLTINHGKEG